MAVKCLKEILAHSLAVTLTELFNISGFDVVLLHSVVGKEQKVSSLHQKGLVASPCTLLANFVLGFISLVHSRLESNS